MFIYSLCSSNQEDHVTNNNTLVMLGTSALRALKFSFCRCLRFRSLITCCVEPSFENCILVLLSILAILLTGTSREGECVEALGMLASIFEFMGFNDFRFGSQLRRHLVRRDGHNSEGLHFLSILL